MPKVIRSEDIDQLAKIVGRFPDGAGLDDILAASGHKLSRRTLQRRLADLTAQGRVTGGREQKSFKYRLAPITGTLEVREESDRMEARVEVYVPTSPKGAEIKAYVRQPIQGRRPVSYNIEFLDAYRPNETWYLPEALRRQLQTLGRSPSDQAPAGTFARDILNRLLIDLSWASSRLEGNTYNRLDTERLIRFGEAAKGKDAIETQMILNHKTAIEYLVHDAEHVAVDAETIVALHALLSDGLLANPMACGKLRNRAVEIGGSVYLPIALPQRIEELFGIALHMAAEIADPFEQAFFLMAHLPYLQPFEDVNKRVSRLAANIPLIKGNLSPLSFIDVPEHAYIDALLGVGLAGPARGRALDLIREINTGFPGAKVVAVDIPSGVDALTGAAGDATMVAVRTVTFQALKPGHLFGAGAERSGEVIVADIGLDVSSSPTWLVEDADVVLPDRRREAHKWQAAVWVVAGSPGMAGAATLAARAAQRAGAGYVRLSVPGGSPGAGAPVEAVGVPLEASGWAAEVLEGLHRFRSAVVGPGLGRGSDGDVRRLVAAATVPLVVDGDGLTALGARPTVPPTTVLTPHDGEFERLAGTAPGADRVDAARSLSAATGGIVLLKGSTTVVAEPGGRVLLSATGDARLASAGTGDVLSGVIGALLAGGVPPFEAAAWGAHLHGLAARLGPARGLVAGDVVDRLPEVLAAVG